jgi:Family of unknown function (DUF6491)
MEKKRFFTYNTPVVLLPLLFFTACATGPDIPSIAEILSKNTGQDGSACLRINEIRRYGVNGDEFIFINGTRGYYIATVNPVCPDIATTPNIAFVGHLNKLCGIRMDKIFTGNNQCTIREIFEFKSSDAATAAYENAIEQQRTLAEQPTNSE